ncbi:hypothetical protein [Halovulum sp. GXIMD14793]
MALTDATNNPTGLAADYAVDLSRNGISLYERVDATGWKLIETVPLQVGALAKNLEHLKLLAGGRDGISPLVEVWLPQDQVKVCCIDFDAASSMEDAVFMAFEAAGAADPLSMSYDFQPQLADGTTPVAGIPADVLREARDFLQAHGFETGLYTTAELPENFARPPEFPLLDQPPVEAPAAPAAVAPTTKTERPAPPKPAPKTTPSPKTSSPADQPLQAPAANPLSKAAKTCRPGAVRPIATKPLTAPEARPRPDLTASLKVKAKQTTPLGAKMFAGVTVAAMVGLGVVGLPMLMSPADTRHLPGDRAQSASTLETPPADTSAGIGLSPVARLYQIDGPADLQGLNRDVAGAEMQPIVPEADSFDALIRPDLPPAPGIGDLTTTLPNLAAAQQAGTLQPIEFSDTLVLLDRFKADVMTSAIAPPLPDEDVVTDHWPDVLALPGRAVLPAAVERIDPTLRFGRFAGAVQTIPDALGASMTPDGVEPVSVGRPEGEDIRPGLPVPVSRSDLALNLGSFLGQVQTETNAPRRVVSVDETTVTRVAMLDQNSGRQAVQPLPMLRDDPALLFLRFEGKVQTVPSGIHELAPVSVADRRVPRVGAALDSVLSTKTPAFASRIDPAHGLERFEGQVALAADILSPDNQTHLLPAPQLHAQPLDTDPVRLAMALPTDDPTTRLTAFTAAVQSVIGGLGTTRTALRFDESSGSPSAVTPIQVIPPGQLDLVDRSSVDEILAHARILEPVAGTAPSEDALAANGFALPVTVSSKSPEIEVAALQLGDEAPVPAAVLDLPNQIALAEPGRSILDGGLISPDLDTSTGAVTGLTHLAARPAAEPAMVLAALSGGHDQPLPQQALPPGLPDPTRSVTPDHVLVITSRPDILPAMRPPVPQAEAIEVAAVADTGIEADAGRADTTLTPQPEDVLAAVTAAQGTDGAETTPAEDSPGVEVALAPTERPEDPLVAVISERPDIVPPVRPAGSAANVSEPDDTAEAGKKHVSDKGVLIVAALPPIVPPNRFGAKNADDSTVMVMEPTQDQLEAAALAIKTKREGDLAPTSFALSKASAPLNRPKGMAEAYEQREEELASLLPSDIALATAESPRSRPSNLKVVAPRPGVTPNVQIKSSTYAPGPQLPTVANVARAATISNALPMREMTLIGVFGATKNRHALIRLPGGKMVKVATGDTVRGYQVTAISADAIRLNRRGKDTLLVIPD